MKKFFAKRINNEYVFEDDELAHFNVLRCRIGEQIICLGNDSYDYLCEITQISKKQAIAKIVSKELNTKNPKVNITIFQGLVKGEKIDLIVQKLTELGITNLVPFESEFSVAKTNDNKINRLNKISQEACKQCGRSVPLNIENTLKFKDMVNRFKNFDIVLFANEKNKIRNYDRIMKSQNIAIIVGGEGGFSDEEIAQINNAGVINFGLGERILRAETACIALASIIGYMVDV